MPGPVFVGGVPRSGTSALTSLISRHSHYAMIPRELGFHTGATGEAGLPDLLEGRIAMSEFLDVMSGHWWKRNVPWDTSVTRGLYKIIPEARFRRCLARFAAAYPSDAFGAARVFMHHMLDPIADEAGKPAWIEMDPANILVASLLYRILPDMRLIHIVRDGRDVALSIADLPWGRGKTPIGGIRQWQWILRKGHKQLQELPNDRVLTITLEDLVVNRREYTYTRILNFLQLEDEETMHTFFADRISAENAHVGRWRATLSPISQMVTTAAYACALGRLAVAGVSPRPALRPVRRFPPGIDFTRHTRERDTIDPWADGKGEDA